MKTGIKATTVTSKELKTPGPITLDIPADQPRAVLLIIPERRDGKMATDDIFIMPFNLDRYASGEITNQYESFCQHYRGRFNLIVLANSNNASKATEALQWLQQKISTNRIDKASLTESRCFLTKNNPLTFSAFSQQRSDDTPFAHVKNTITKSPHGRTPITCRTLFFLHKSRMPPHSDADETAKPSTRHISAH